MGIDGPVDPGKMYPSIESIVEHFEGVTLRRVGGPEMSGMTDEELHGHLSVLLENDVRIHEMVEMAATALSNTNDLVILHQDLLSLLSTRAENLHERTQSLERTRGLQAILNLLLIAAIAYLLLR